MLDPELSITTDPSCKVTDRFLPYGTRIVFFCTLPFSIRASFWVKTPFERVTTVLPFLLWTVASDSGSRVKTSPLSNWSVIWFESTSTGTTIWGLWFSKKNKDEPTTIIITAACFQIWLPAYNGFTYEVSLCLIVCNFLNTSLLFFFFTHSYKMANSSCEASWLIYLVIILLISILVIWKILSLLKET